MGYFGALRTLFSTLLAGVMTFTLVWADLRGSRESAMESGLILSHQVASQVDGMSLYAKSHGEADPVRWAVRLLAQGNDPLAYHISVIERPLDRTPASLPESARLNWEESTLDYSTLVSPESSEVVHIRANLETYGFLGAHSRNAQDLRILSVFVLIFAICWLAAGHLSVFKRDRDAEQIEQIIAPQVVVDDELRLRVVHWAGDFKAVLVSMGGSIREVIRTASQITVAAATARDYVGALRGRIHKDLTMIEKSRKEIQGLSQKNAQAEALALNLVLEVARLGDSAKPLAEMAQKLHQHIQSNRHAVEGAENAITELTAQLEPAATDADQAYHSFEDVFENARGMDEHIKKVTESLVNQAKTIQEIGKKAG